VFFCVFGLSRADFYFFVPLLPHHACFSDAE